MSKVSPLKRKLPALSRSNASTPSPKGKRKTKSEQSSPTSIGLFNGYRICLVSGFGADMSAARCAIFEKQIINEGGTASLFKPSPKKKANAETISDDFDHIVVSAECPRSFIESRNWTNKILVTPEWISTSLLSRQLHPVEQYRWSEVTDEAAAACDAEEQSPISGSTASSPRFIPVASGPAPLSPLADGLHFVKTSKAEPMNDIIAHVLEELMDIYAAMGDDWREYAYRKAAEIIKKLDFGIYGADDLEKIDRAAIKGLGQKMMDKLKEIADTGTLQKLQLFEHDEKVQTLLLFSRIWGAGSKTALGWYNHGFRSLKDLIKSDEVNFQQEIGIRYYEELLQRIPRSEVKDIEDNVRKAFEIALRERNREFLPSNLQVVTCGSYRRGSETCGDVDLVITDGSDDPRVSEGLLLQVIQILEKQGFLSDHLSLPSRDSQLHDDGEQTWTETYMGICQRSKDDFHRRLDIKFYPKRLFAYGLIHFTGSEMFGRALRIFVKGKGWTFSDHGLRKTVRSSENERIWKGSAFDCLTEEAIFRKLGLKYLEPWERTAKVVITDLIDPSLNSEFNRS